MALYAYSAYRGKAAGEGAPSTPSPVSLKGCKMMWGEDRQQGSVTPFVWWGDVNGVQGVKRVKQHKGAWGDGGQLCSIAHLAWWWSGGRSVKSVEVAKGEPFFWWLHVTPCVCLHAASVNKFKQAQTSSNKFKQVQTSSNKPKQVQTSSNKLKQAQTSSAK